MDEQEKRAKASLQSALDAMLPLLQAASTAAHELESPDDDEAEFNRIMDLGHLTEGAANLCGPRVKLLSDICHLLLEMEHEDESEAAEVRSQEQRLQ